MTEYQVRIQNLNLFSNPDFYHAVRVFAFIIYAVPLFTLGFIVNTKLTAIASFITMGFGVAINALYSYLLIINYRVKILLHRLPNNRRIYSMHQDLMFRVAMAMCLSAVVLQFYVVIELVHTSKAERCASLELERNQTLEEQNFLDAFTTDTRCRKSEITLTANACAIFLAFITYLIIDDSIAAVKVSNPAHLIPAVQKKSIRIQQNQ